MQQTFTLHIRLGNETCQSAQDVAELLVAVAERLANREDWTGLIRDVNGNSVGLFGLEEV
jgi:hypothetical protein